ncbi:MAG: DUF115 domain-containing protein [Spirochaetales bacterium]|uniref:DUF115 domain-containing protein n=1 Tax=Candidatus Thalassospirochaeta sargassi TaxID=3119039 RepID=A0AAJ1MPB0_9SPIO|nr:DUF115 domain-containing protein [Spirochaetales bacterium]
MFDSGIFDRNLLSLSLHNEELAIELTHTKTNSSISFKTSRTGCLVPFIVHNQREYSLHSLFDPEKEARRYSDSIKVGGYIVVLGFGAGYHIKALLDRKDINSILIIDRNIELFKSILGAIDLSDILSDPRVTLLVDKSPDYIKDFLPSNYLPAVTGDFSTISLRSRIESEKEYFNSVLNSIRNVLDTLSDDYTVQTWFGKRWFVNTVANLKSAEKAVTVLPPVRDVIIAAAGPSLEMQLNDLLQKSAENFLISTDTALSCLLKNGIKPDLVISIDCQQITYHHFMAGFPKDIPLVMDMASPPLLSRLSDKTFFFASAHPFSKYINRNWRKFPFVDTSGGNVTHAAISLADKLGARSIRIYGADFSYPEGKSYARGTYIYPYFTSKSIRTEPLESEFYRFLYRNDNITMLKTEYGYRYQTRPMLSYKERLESFAENINAGIIPVYGLGEPISVPVKKPASPSSQFFSAGVCRTSWREFLSSYKTKLKNLNVPDIPPSRYLAGLDFTDLDIWTTLFPAAAVLRKKYRDTDITSPEILREIRKWALDVIEQNLD